mmetsp:Transcript_6258/g.17937  ORF Transcript_6258/g.17937 Transcript_6258/m.17937 type:complete len:438 (-) Transcript_6258:129-1442(-)
MGGLRAASDLLRRGMLSPLLGHIRCVVVALLLSFCLTLIGALALSVLEDGAEQEAFEQRASMQRRLRAELSPQTYDDLVRGGWWEHTHEGTAEERMWSLSDRNAAGRPLLFAFTLSSTIGYGNAELRTDAGKAFAAIFSIFAIPFTIAVYMVVASHLTSLLQVVLLSVMHPSWSTFRKYDTSGDGTLEASEFRAALKDMGVTHVTQNIALLIIERLQQHDCRLTYDQFCRAVRVLLPPRVESQHRHARIIAAFLMCLGWIAVGGGVFSFCEGWRFGDAVWFSWITLTTIGLGDFVPRTSTGVLATVLWSIVGLGLVAMLASTVAEKLAHAARLEDDDEGEQPTDAEKCEIRVRHMLSQSSNLLALCRQNRIRRASTVRYIGTEATPTAQRTSNSFHCPERGMNLQLSERSFASDVSFPFDGSARTVNRCRSAVSFGT